MMLSLLALPCEGHLYQVLQIFSHLRKYHNAEMVYDPSDPTINHDRFEWKDWTSSKFGNIDEEEELPPRMPNP